MDDNDDDRPLDDSRTAALDAVDQLPGLLKRIRSLERERDKRDDQELADRRQDLSELKRKVRDEEQAILDLPAAKRLQLAHGAELLEVGWLAEEGWLDSAKLVRAFARDHALEVRVDSWYTPVTQENASSIVQFHLDWTNRDTHPLALSSALLTFFHNDGHQSASLDFGLPNAFRVPFKWDSTASIGSDDIASFLSAQPISSATAAFFATLVHRMPIDLHITHVEAVRHEYWHSLTPPFSVSRLFP